MRAPLCRRLQKLEAAERAADADALNRVLVNHLDADLDASDRAFVSMLARHGFDVENGDSTEAYALLETSEAFRVDFIAATAGTPRLAFIAVVRQRTGHTPTVLPDQGQLDRWWVTVASRVGTRGRQ